MDSYPNEHPTGGFFGGGYESAFQAIRLDSDKNQATGSPLGIYTKFASNGSTSDFQESRLLRLNRFVCKKYPQNYFQKRVSFCMRRRISKDAGVKCCLIQSEKRRITVI